MPQTREQGLTILTVGHSNMGLREFTELIGGQGVDVLLDTRSNPFSRWAPHFGREFLRDAAREAPFAYRYLGDSLGGKPRDRRFYDEDGGVDYEAIAREDSYVAGIEQALALAREGVACLLCAEEDPIACHRRLLIGKTLRERGVALRHLRRDGSLEDEQDVQWRYRRKRRKPPQRMQGALALA